MRTAEPATAGRSSGWHARSAEGLPARLMMVIRRFVRHVDVRIGRARAAENLSPRLAESLATVPCAALAPDITLSRSHAPTVDSYRAIYLERQAIASMDPCVRGVAGKPSRPAVCVTDIVRWSVEMKIVRYVVNVRPQSLRDICAQRAAAAYPVAGLLLVQVAL